MAATFVTESTHSSSSDKIGSATTRHHRRSKQYGSSELLLEVNAQQTGRRRSVFLEVGLGGQDAIVDDQMRRSSIPQLPADAKPELWTDPIPAPVVKTINRRYTFSLSTMSQLLLLGVLIAILSPGLYSHTFSIDLSPPGAEAVPLETHDQILPRADQHMAIRADSPTDVCKRWAHMSAVVNGTLYIYGGEASSTSDQKENTWNNNFLSLDLTKSWQIATPALVGLPQPSGPPAVSLGVLWNDLNNLYLYGGEFSWQPVTSPTPFSTWSYSIASKSWSEHTGPKDSDGQAVQRAAEGAGISVPGLGRGYYLGGHLDGYTTVGWSQSIDRLYLESTLEYTMPGHTNAALPNVPLSGTAGIYRNISTGSAGFPQRADGSLVYVPGYGDAGIIIGVGGGTNQSYTQMNILDVYDIATSKWYKQSTSGPTPKTRVNTCVVALSVADGSSTQVHMYGGQNLQPAGEQTQYDDMWILTVPSFTWIEVNQTGQSTPPPRAGHSCNVWNGQMVIVGGYVGQELSCDSPGIYIFNTSALSWQNQYNALEAQDDLNRQHSQSNDLNALQGSYGYGVPALVRSQIGGDAAGSATVTQPAQTVTQGPLVTGRPKTYTVTGSDGAIATQTARPDGSGSGSNDGSSGGGDGPRSNAGAIAAGVVAGILAILAAYLGFCVWLYRKQLQLYKHHVSMARREQFSDETNHPLTFAVASRFNDKDRMSDQRRSADSRSGHSAGAYTGSNSSGRMGTLGTNNPYNHVAGGRGFATADSSTEDLMSGHEPSFLGVMLNPKRSLRVVNRD